MLGSQRETSGDGSRDNLGAGTNSAAPLRFGSHKPSLQALGLWGLQRFRGLGAERRLFQSEQTQVNISTDTLSADTMFM